jgi:Tat protein secretion system quality control protein TatD with DNase activity
LDRVLLETDAPYLPPPGVEDMRRPNHPWTLSIVARAVAPWKGCSPGMLLTAARLNAQKLYGPFPGAN